MDFDKIFNLKVKFSRELMNLLTLVKCQFKKKITIVN